LSVKKRRYSRRQNNRLRSRRTINLELLEQRQLLATFTPNVFADAPLNAGNDATEFTLREAIIAANAGAGADTIDLTAIGAGTFNLTINGGNDSSGDLDIRNDDLDINGLGSAQTIINGGGSGGTLQNRLFEVHGGSIHNQEQLSVSFTGLELTGGFLQASHGGGLANNYGTISLSDVIIDANIVQSTGSADRHGGGIWSRGGSVTGTNVDFTNNIAERNGGSNNNVGGGFWLNEDATADFTNVNLTGNVAREGGGFYTSNGNFGGSTVTLSNALFDANTAIVRGGGFDNASRTATVTINTGTISNNTAEQEHGGGFYNNGRVVLDAVDISDNIILDNNSTRPDDAHGGGFFNNAAGAHPNAGRVDMTGGSITGNTAYGHGGGFWNRNGFVTITGTSGDPVEINSNRAGIFDGTASDTRSGGGFWNTDAAETKLTWVNFYDGAGTQNKVYSVGGTDADSALRGVGAGFYNSSQSTVYLDNVDITNHRADSGGAFYQDGIQSQVIGTNVTLDDNFARIRGGAFRNATTGGIVELTDSSIDGNTANEEYGGGFYNNGTTTLDNTDVSNNIALDFSNSNRRDGHGGGFYNGGGIVNLTNGSDVLKNSNYGYGAGFWNSGGVVDATGSKIDGNSQFTTTARDTEADFGTVVILSQT
jgi:hypothetical protein